MFWCWWLDLRRFFTSRGRMSPKIIHSSILYAGPSLYFMLLVIGLFYCCGRFWCPKKTSSVFKFIRPKVQDKIQGKCTIMDPKNPRTQAKNPRELTGWSPVWYGLKANNLVQRNKKVQRTTSQQHRAKRNDIVWRIQGPNTDEQWESLAWQQRVKNINKNAKANNIVQKRSDQMTRSKDRRQCWKNVNSKQRNKIEQRTRTYWLTSQSPLSSCQRRSQIRPFPMKRCSPGVMTIETTKRGHQFVVQMWEIQNLSLHILKEMGGRPNKFSWPASSTRLIIIDYGLTYYIGKQDGDTPIHKPGSMWSLRSTDLDHSWWGLFDHYQFLIELAFRHQQVCEETVTPTGKRRGKARACAAMSYAWRFFFIGWRAFWDAESTSTMNKRTSGNMSSKNKTRP